MTAWLLTGQKKKVGLGLRLSGIKVIDHMASRCCTECCDSVM